MPPRRAVWGGLILSIFVSLTALRAEEPGGSNYAWYKVEACNASPYGVITNFAEARPIVETQLREMFENGQRRLRLPFFYRRDAPPGETGITDKGIAPKEIANIESLLELIKDIGFSELVFGFFPQSESGPNWDHWREDIYQENWRAVQQIREVLQRSNMRYMIDLLNEAMPHAHQTILMEYARRLWSDYSERYGTEDTVGFSMIADPGRIASMPKVYGSRVPPVIELHIYERIPETVLASKQALDRIGLGHIPWIIGEMLYNDEQAVSELRSSAARAGVELSYMLQWPGVRNDPCKGTSVVPLLVPRSLADPPRDFYPEVARRRRGSYR